MKDIRPGQADPIASGDQPERLVTILVRFFVLLIVAIAILTIAWNRP